MTFKKVGVIGAGTMGIGVAYNLAIYGIEAVLVDVEQKQLNKAKEEIINNIKFMPLISKQIPKIPMEEIINKIQFTTDIKNLSECEFIVENATEKWEIKEEIYKSIDKICKEDVCFAVNTSCISITKIGALTSRADKIMGMHIMNPSCLKSFVEVIKGFHTSDESIEKGCKFLEQIKKKGIVVNDSPGFVSNRISHLMMNEAAFVLQDQVGTVEQIDLIFKECFGHKMGPLETADLIGIDTVVNSIDVLYESYKDPKFRLFMVN
jgi:3-hydroxybutyryl-CoA dehydrogenase